VARAVDVPGGGQAKIIPRGSLPCSRRVALGIYYIFSFGSPTRFRYAQSHLNRLWEHVAAEREKAALGMPGSLA
jgi:hypothetical protein